MNSEVPYKNIIYNLMDPPREHPVIYCVYKIDLDITIVMDVPKRGQQSSVR